MRNTINDAATHTSLSLLFLRGGGGCTQATVTVESANGPKLWSMLNLKYQPRNTIPFQSAQGHPGSVFHVCQIFASLKEGQEYLDLL